MSRLSLSSIDQWDRWLLFASLALALISALVMASAASSVNPRLAIRHWTWMGIGIMICWGLANTDYRRWLDLSILVYGVSLIVLAIVPVAGAMRLGATRWLSLFGLSLQPSEFAKLSTIWMLARYLSGQPRPLSGQVIGISLLLAGLPALMVFSQPDLGSASIFGAIWLGMIWVAGASRRTLLSVAATGTVLLPIGWHLLKGYQRDRLLAFIDPHADPLGTGFSIIQSTIAIGSGQWWGRGWFAGTQNQLRFLPERHSDFIFSVIGEEWGFLGSVAVIMVFALLVMRILRIAQRMTDPQASLVAAGVGAWLGYQTFVNIGMVMGVLPVVGVPLPFMSYGGSSMVTVWIALGLLHAMVRSASAER